MTVWKFLFFLRKIIQFKSHWKLVVRSFKKRTVLYFNLHKTTGLPGPSIVNFTLTNLCNHNCRTCTYRVSNRINNNVKFIPLDLVKRTIDNLAPFGTSLLFAGGGEPTLYPWLGHVIDYATQRKLYTEITTNGYVLKKRAKEIMAAGIGGIVISIDGKREIHNYVRNTDRAFEKAIEGILELNKYRSRPLIAISTTVSPANWYALPELFEIVERLVKSRMVDYMMIRHMQYFLSNKNVEEHNQKFGNSLFFAKKNSYEDLKFTTIDFTRLCQYIRWSDKKFNWLIWVGKKLSLQELNKYYTQPEVFIVEKKVYCPWVFANITEDGDVVLCNEVTNNNNFCFGNLHEKSFMEIWNNSPKLINFRKVLQKYDRLPICTRCCAYIGTKI